MSYPQMVVIYIEGGLGDQVDAEPVVRKLKSIYHDTRLILIANHPQIFNHLELETHKPGFQVPIGAFVINTLKPIDHVSKKYMVHKLCHGVDYASLQCLRGTLAAKEKEIQLTFESKHLARVEELCGRDISNLVVLHPGRGWASKTFPADVWDSWIDALLEHGYHVAVIGKYVHKTQGVVELKPRMHLNFINLINQLSLKETFALLSKAPILISNDSSPIHIAGAFDNHIGVIATCKHPELILPYRGGVGNVWYKATSLEKQKMYDEYKHHPAKENLSLIYYLPENVSSIRPYLPSSADILEFVQSRIGGITDPIVID